MIILALNCGSSSVKYKLYKWGERKELASGEIERIGLESGCPDHKTALRSIVEKLTLGDSPVLKNIHDISAIGHRVVHGGEKFKCSVLIDDEVLEAIRSVQDLAPLHNPHNIAGIQAAKELLPEVPQIAVFDTAFHQTMPEHSFLYPVPYEWYKMYGVRRYGFHGTSHLYVSRRAAVLLNKKPAEVNLITMHIGNGVSIAAVKNGISVDTSMGLTPLEGAVMGTRCGDIDPAIILFMIEKEGFYVEELDKILNKKSGLLGITGKYMDRRDIEKAAMAGDVRSQLAIQIEAYRLRKYIGSYLSVVGKADAIVFTAGAGEMNVKLREAVLIDMEHLGIKLDKGRNEKARTRDKETLISADDSPIKVFVIPTDEEIVFVEDVIAILEGRYKTHTNFTYSFEMPEYKKGK